jgi:hypothetical protein
MGFSPFDGFMFSAIPVIVGIGFVVIIGLIVIMAVRSGIQWDKNNHSPVLTVAARIVSKRTAVSHHHHHHDQDIAMHHASSSTTYFVTFQVESGDRMELRVPDREYGLLAEGDIGRLTFQGTRYKGFERERA